MVKNTYNNLEFALKEKGFWTPADEHRPDNDSLIGINIEQEQNQENNSIAAGA